MSHPAVQAQADLVRKLKSEKADKAEIKSAVEKLLALKEEHGEATAPAKASKQAKPAKEKAAKEKEAPAAAAAAVHPAVQAQADLVRKLKTEKADKGEVKAAVDKLLALKAEHGAGAPPAKAKAGSEKSGSEKSGSEKSKKEKPAQAPKKGEKKGGEKEEKKGDSKKGSRNEEGLSVKKEEDFANWYSQIVIKGELIDYYDISGCYILRPWSYEIWESIQHFFDAEIKKIGVKNCYFPLFVSKAALHKEEEHIEDFAPEVAWVTQSGKTNLDQPIAIRPTSETIMYPAMAKWIRSHRDLPLRLNQWCNVVRWEFKCPTPFIRSREFLWQEGHSAFANIHDAEVEVVDILNLYARIYEDLLCVPVVKGKKTELEKFAGGTYTTTVEAYIPSTGRGIQGATSHHLGKNFSNMFDISFLDTEGKQDKVFQNSWGCTTRTIGVMVMMHGDNKGLVLPPRVAPLQAIVIPIYFKEKEALNTKAQELVDIMRAAGMRADMDLRENYNPGWKFNYYELKGVPFQIQLGPRDMEAKQVVVVRRDTGEKFDVKWADLACTMKAQCIRMQRELLENARAKVAAVTEQVSTWPQFLNALDHKKRVLAPWCGSKACEETIKEKSKEHSEAAGNVDTGAVEGEVLPSDAEKLSGAAKSLCTPFVQPDMPSGTCCVYCGAAAINYTLFGRSY